ncbi:hypothetical protein B0T16DRAFT_188109 [Cercophora newfieldiana]|uniref:DUF676 domain-containing protein n=1 Tax=Cercophora newfieldiana TaxID=92897 RepID=A0AA39Y0M5_9PEZI|nr:hypothetical protein B0T16DRAFT_188109 [Cercophora newfieldiana]
MANVYRPRAGTVFRVRGIPTNWDASQTESILAEHYGPTSAPTVQSLAQEVHRRSQTATFTFLHDVSMPMVNRPNGVWRVPLPKSLSGRRANQYLILDTDFHGITTLFTPPVDQHKLDVIAISGIGGHAFGSFKERGGDHMWLRDSLPLDLTLGDTDRPISRVMTYGFESTMAESRSVQSLEDLATSFRDSILTIVGDTVPRPVIFIAHSLGGLIVKEMLILLSKSKSEDGLRLFQAVAGILFFGVPHDGIDISSFILMVGDGPNRSLVESLSSENSHVLGTQRTSFYRAMTEGHGCEIVCFYETDRSPTATREHDGVWKMTGPAVTLVSKASATHCRPWEDSPEHACAIARTHSDMVKFGPEDHEYDKVCDRLRSLARRSLLRWEAIRSGPPSSI